MSAVLLLAITHTPSDEGISDGIFVFAVVVVAIMLIAKGWTYLKQSSKSGRHSALQSAAYGAALSVPTVILWAVAGIFMVGFVALFMIELLPLIPIVLAYYLLFGGANAKREAARAVAEKARAAKEKEREEWRHEKARRDAAEQAAKDQEAQRKAAVWAAQKAHCEAEQRDGALVFFVSGKLPGGIPYEDGTLVPASYFILSYLPQGAPPDPGRTSADPEEKAFAERHALEASEAHGQRCTAHSNQELPRKKEEVFAKLAAGELSADDASKLLNEIAAGKSSVDAPSKMLAEVPKPKRGTLYCRLSKRGAISVWGVQRMPVTFCAEQWHRLLDFSTELRNFMAESDEMIRVSREMNNSRLRPGRYKVGIMPYDDHEQAKPGLVPDEYLHAKTSPVEVHVGNLDPLIIKVKKPADDKEARKDQNDFS
jgi:hypothetical protein